MKLVLVSEREGSAWEDCVWCSGVMLGNVLVGENRYPATRTEYEGLRFSATGVREAEGDGSNYGELERGLAVRYKITPIRRGRGFDAMLGEVPINDYAALQGWTGSLPSRLQISGPVGHSLVVQRVAATQFDLYDPLAVNGSDPRRITVDELRRFYAGLPGAEWIAAYEGEAWREPMIRINLERWKLPAGTLVYEHAVATGVPITRFRDPVEVTTIGVPLDHSADGVDYGWRALLLSTSALDGKSSRKIAFIRRPTGDALPTDAAWDAAVLQALTDPEFRGGSVIDATEAQIAAAQLAGVKEGINRADASIEALKASV